MKVVCRGYKTCSHKYKCYHSIPHERVMEQITKPDFYNCVSKCGTECKTTDCSCSAVHLRKEKLEKLYEENNK